MNHKGRLWKPALAAVAVGAGVWGLASLAGVSLWGTGDSPLEVNSQQTAGTSSGHPEIEPGYVMVGGVKRPLSDVEPAKRPADSEPGADFPSYGRTPRVRPDANPQVKAAVEAIRTKQHPERLSPAVLPKPFDAAAFRANPQAYLEVPEPGRVWQTLPPGPGVPRLGMISERFHAVLQGDPLKLQVSAPAGSPVSFTSFDGGRFTANQLNTITVVANEDGVAEAEFVGTPGTIEDVHILAGSPLASGQAKFVVNVQLPATP